MVEFYVRVVDVASHVRVAITGIGSGGVATVGTGVATGVIVLVFLLLVWLMLKVLVWPVVVLCCFGCWYWWCVLGYRCRWCWVGMTSGCGSSGVICVIDVGGVVATGIIDTFNHWY